MGHESNYPCPERSSCLRASPCLQPIAEIEKSTWALESLPPVLQGNVQSFLRILLPLFSRNPWHAHVVRFSISHAIHTASAPLLMFHVAEQHSSPSLLITFNLTASSRRYFLEPSSYYTTVRGLAGQITAPDEDRGKPVKNMINGGGGVRCCMTTCYGFLLVLGGILYSAIQDPCGRESH